MGVKVKEWKGAWWLFIDHQGKRKAKRVGVGKQGRKAAELASVQIQAKLASGDGMVFEGERVRVQTFRKAAEEWLETYSKLGQLRVTTVALYARNLNSYVFPRFGDRPVTAVVREDVRTLVADLLAKGKSRSLVRNVVAPIRQTFNQLAEDGVVISNPASRIGRYLKGRGDARVRAEPLTPQEEGCFLDCGFRSKVNTQIGPT